MKALIAIVAAVALVGCGQQRLHPAYFEAAQQVCSSFGGVKTFEIDLYNARDGIQVFEVKAFCADNKTVVEQTVKAKV